jgi:cytoskeletal protein CcmA (bactofilin family)
VSKVNHLQLNKKLGLVFLMSLLLFVFVPSAMAFDGRGGDNVIIESDEVIEDDLYVGANTFVLNGTIKGDLIVGASEISINGTVEGDLLAGGQLVVINGAIADDARIGAMAIEMGEGAEIGDDLIAAGYSLHGKSGSLVSKDLVFAGFQALLEGDVNEDVWMGVNSLQVNGRVAGNITAEISSEDSAPPVNPYQFMPDAPTMPVVPSGLTVNDAAEIGGDLTYRSPQPFDVPSGAVDGDVDFTHEVVSTDGDGQPSTGQTIWQHVRRFITLALFGALLIWQAPTFVTRLSDQIQKKPVPSLGWGALVYFGVPVIIIALFVIGILLALLFGALQFGNLSSAVIFVLLAVIIAFMVAFVLVLLYLTKIIVGYFVGHLILQQVSPTLADTPYWPLLLGLLLVVVVIAIPWLGSLVNWIIAVVGVGALWLLWRSDKIPKEKIA